MSLLLAMSGAAFVLPPGEGEEEPWLDGWSFRAKITSLSSQIPAAYPYALRIDCGVHFEAESDFWANIKADGGDIRVTLADKETEVARAVRDFDAASQRGVIYVYHPGISASADADLYIYWGNVGASDYDNDHALGAEGIWGPSGSREAIALHHLLSKGDIEEGVSIDLSGHGNHGTVLDGTVNFEAFGEIDVYSPSGNGTGIEVLHAASLAEFTALTLLCWVKPIDEGGSGGRVLQKGDGGTGDDYGLIWRNTDAQPARAWFRINNTTLSTGDNAAPPNEWHFWAGLWGTDTNEEQILIDAVLAAQATQNVTLSNNQMDLGIGTHADDSSNNRNLQGGLYNGRLIGRRLSNSEVTTIYACEGANATFWQAGSVEEASDEGTGGQLIDDEGGNPILDEAGEQILSE